MLSAFILHAPRVLAAGSWDDAREETAGKLIDKITEYAPNFRDAVIDWVLITPEDMESRVGLTNGNIHHLDLVDSQMLSNRPSSRLVRLPDAHKGAISLRCRYSSGWRSNGGAGAQCRPPGYKRLGLLTEAGQF